MLTKITEKYAIDITKIFFLEIEETNLCLEFDNGVEDIIYYDTKEEAIKIFNIIVNNATIFKKVTEKQAININKIITIELKRKALYILFKGCEGKTISIYYDTDEEAIKTFNKITHINIQYKYTTNVGYELKYPYID